MVATVQTNAWTTGDHVCRVDDLLLTVLLGQDRGELLALRCSGCNEVWKLRPGWSGVIKCFAEERQGEGERIGGVTEVRP